MTFILMPQLHGAVIDDVEVIGGRAILDDDVLPGRVRSDDGTGGDAGGKVGTKVVERRETGSGTPRSRSRATFYETPPAKVVSPTGTR